MKKQTIQILAGALCLSIASSTAEAREPDATLKLWPGKPPGATPATGPEKKLEGRPRPFYQLENISVPVLEVFQPGGESNGTAVLVCPGGGLRRLAYEHEGLEVADWLNSLGLTAFVLKYRVPAPAETGLKDAQRAMGLIRGHADRWNIDANAVGVLGFSAGGEIAVWLATHSAARQYDAIDGSDALSCRPDFVGLVYPGGLIRRGAIKEPIADRITSELAPVFVTHAFDDFCQNSLLLAVALKEASVPTELHLFQDGGHGFGARTTGVPVDNWKDRFAEWLQSLGHFDPPYIREHVSAWIGALDADQPPPSFATSNPKATLADAYLAQRRLVRKTLEKKTIGGFKGAGASAAAQASMGIDRPLTGVLFQDGVMTIEENFVVDLSETGATAVETEIGYIMGVDFSYEVLTDQQAKDVVAGIVPVIELPRQFPSAAPSTPRDMVASNVGSARIVQGRRWTPAEIDPNDLDIVLKRDDEVLHETNGGIANGGQWRNLRLILNQITSQGYTIPAGSVVICGALGGVHPGVPGRYEAIFGGHEIIRFEIR